MDAPSSGSEEPGSYILYYSVSRCLRGFRALSLFDLSLACLLRADVEVRVLGEFRGAGEQAEVLVADNHA